ncbi:MAG: response regulator [Desulfobacteraceae bacterium]|nr:MAG: response regulator [Desulfobacteraceae bacterium]
MKVLIVDDEFVSRKKAQKILSQFAECDVAMHGKEALEAFKIAHHEGQPYDLITMDIIMPDMDGIEALKRVRAWEEEHGIPLGRGVKILMLTGNKKPDAVLTSYAEGCEDYLVKPFNREKLVLMLNGLGFKQIH